MRLYKNIFFLIIFLATQINALAQPLNELLDLAKENNLELKILEKEYLAALEKAPQVSQLPDPEVGIGLFPLPVETRLGPQLIRVGATQMLPWKGLLKGKKDLELAKAKALYERTRARALDVFYQIKQSYYKLYEIEKSQIVIRKSIVILETLERLALTKVESGKATTADVLRVQLKTEELRQELIILEKNKINPIASINQLLNRSLQTPITTVDTLAFAVLPFDKNALMETIKKNHPLLRMFELQQDISRQAITLNGLNGKPSFGVGLDYILVNKRKDADPTRNGRDIVQLRASVKIPLNRNKYDAKEREENIKITALADKKTDVFNQFMAAIEKAYADYEVAELRMNLYQKQMEITKAAIRILQTTYSVKGKNFDELLRLEKELIDYDLKILKVIVQSHLAKTNVERFF